jgi:hypothetical protein
MSKEYDNGFSDGLKAGQSSSVAAEEFMLAENKRLYEKNAELESQLAAANEKIARAGEPVGVVRMSNPSDGNPKPVPKWIMSKLDEVFNLKDGDLLYALPHNTVELMRENEELKRKLSELGIK